MALAITSLPLSKKNLVLLIIIITTTVIIAFLSGQPLLAVVNQSCCSLVGFHCLHAWSRGVRKSHLILNKTYALWSY